MRYEDKGYNVENEPTEYDEGKVMKRIIVIAFAVVLVGLFVIFLILESPFHQLLNDDSRELAVRAVCMGNQKTIYLALKIYYNDYNELPLNLLFLARQSYIKEKELYCPEPPEKADIRFYKYYPDNWENPELPLISENIDNHAGKRLRLRKIKPMIIQTMGDGTIVKRETDNKK